MKNKEGRVVFFFFFLNSDGFTVIAKFLTFDFIVQLVKGVSDNFFKFGTRLITFSNYRDGRCKLPFFKKKKKIGVH